MKFILGSRLNVIYFNPADTAYPGFNPLEVTNQHLIRDHWRFGVLGDSWGPRLEYMPAWIHYFGFAGSIQRQCSTLLHANRYEFERNVDLRQDRGFFGNSGMLNLLAE